MADEIIGNVQELMQFDIYNDLNRTILFKSFTRRFVKGEVIQPPLRFNLKIKVGNIDTTVGRYVFNKYCLPVQYFEDFGFLNAEIDKGVYEKLGKDITTLLLSRRIDEEKYAETIDRINWLGNTLSNYSGDSFDSSSFVLSAEVKIALEEFLSSPKDKLTDPEFVLDWQNKLIKLVETTMSDRSLVKMIKAGVKGDFGNNFKNMALFRGIVDGDFVPNNLVNGNSFDSYTKLGKNAVIGSSGRAIKTAQGGYGTKLISNAYNSTRLEEGDCGSTETLLITNFNPDEFKFRNIRIHNGRNTGFFEVNDFKNAPKYKGKTVQVRSPMFCRNKKGICEKCLGEIYKYNNIRDNLAVYPISLSSDIMMKSMKAFHNTESKYTKIDFKKELL